VPLENPLVVLIPPFQQTHVLRVVRCRGAPPGRSPITTVGGFDTIETAQLATDEE
jgi:hypothetical protein